MYFLGCFPMCICKLRRFNDKHTAGLVFKSEIILIWCISVTTANMILMYNLST